MTHVTQLSRRAKVKLVKQHRGMIGRIARKFKVDQTHVGRVLRGESKSARIAKAIDLELAKELRKAERRATTDPVEARQ